MAQSVEVSALVPPQCERTCVRPFKPSCLIKTLFYLNPKIGLRRFFRWLKILHCLYNVFINQCPCSSLPPSFFCGLWFPPTCMAVVGVRGENPQGSLRSGYLANSGSSTYPRWLGGNLPRELQPDFGRCGILNSLKKHHEIAKNWENGDDVHHKVGWLQNYRTEKNWIKIHWQADLNLSEKDESNLMTITVDHHCWPSLLTITVDSMNGQEKKGFEQKHGKT